jgi:hypothetical protein
VLKMPNKGKQKRKSSGSSHSSNKKHPPKHAKSDNVLPNKLRSGLKSQNFIQSRDTSPALSEDIQDQPSVKNTFMSSTSIKNDDKIIKTKPIFAEINLKVMKTYLQGKAFNASPELNMNNVKKDNKVITERVKIQPFSSSDKVKIITVLKERGIKFFSFTEHDQKLPVFLLKKHHFEELDELKAIFARSKIPACIIKFFSKSEHSPIYLVKFSDTQMNLATLNNKFSRIEGVVVEWDSIRPNKKNYTQCHNCQRWGHSSSNCGYQYRCMACGDSSHEPGKCPRKSTIIESRPPAKCCNCDGDHTSNFKQCKEFKSYSSKIKENRKKSSKFAHLAQQVLQQQVAPDVTEQSFPHLSPHYNHHHHETTPLPTSSTSQIRIEKNTQIHQHFVKPSQPENFENYSRQSGPAFQSPAYREAVLNGTSGESLSHSNLTPFTTTQCNNCNYLVETVKSLQAQILELSSKLNQFTAASKASSLSSLS